MTFSGRFVLSMIQYAVANGSDFNRLLEMTGHDYEFLCDEESRVESAVYNRVVENSVLETGDEFFGLHAGEYLNLSAAGLIGQITQTSGTVKEALEYCCEFASLGCRALPMKLIKVEEGYQLNFIPDKLWATESAVAVKQTIDGTLAFSLREFHLLTLQKYYPKEVGFGFKRPANVSEYERIFKCPVKFSQKHTYMQFEKDQIEAKVVTSDFNLLRNLVEYAHIKVEEIQSESGFYQHIRRSVLNLMNPYFPSIEAVAANANLSVRTLQRRLKEDGYVYKDVVERLKEEIATNYLRTGDLSIKEIADSLGYSDTSAFTRAFKNRTGKTPSQFLA